MPRQPRLLVLLCRHGDLLAAMGVLATILAVFLAVALPNTGGALVYAFDDAYIHLAIAKNLVRHGVWGVTRYGFSSSSSSLAWPLLLAAVFVPVGVRAEVAFGLAAASAVLCLWVATRLLRRAGISGPWRFVVLLLLVLGTPVPTLVFSGMEHLLHASLTLLAAAVAVPLVVDGRQGNAFDRRTLAILAAILALLVAVRFEGLFLVGALTILLAAPRAFRAGAGLAAAAVLPAAVYGAVSVAHGWQVLPASVLLKGKARELLSPVTALPTLTERVAGLRQAPVIVVLLAAVAIFLFVVRSGGPRRAEEARVMGKMYLITASVHIGFAGIGWFYRYEGYLVVLGTIALAQLIQAAITVGDGTARRLLLARRAVAGTVSLIAGVMLVLRGGEALVRTPRACVNIFSQQMQTAHFLHRFYDGEPVAINDIGAVCFATDVHVLDLGGLASREVAVAKLHGTFRAEEVARWSTERGVRVAMVYQNALPGVVPGWRRVAWLGIVDNVVCGESVVEVIATAAGEEGRLRDNLRAFLPFLPVSVVVGLEPDSGPTTIRR